MILAVVDNKKLLEEINGSRQFIKEMRKNKNVMDAFMEDFALRFCWSSNAIEGNTLSLDETVAVIEYDEVRSGHTYREYRDAKSLYRAIKDYLLPFESGTVTEEWVKGVHRTLMDAEDGYRKGDVYIGSLIEAVYYPPAPEAVPGLMEEFFEAALQETEIARCIEEAAGQHIRFERIHPFADGNGRTGRMILNQQLINGGLLPVSISPRGKYRQAFRLYDRNKDISMMVHEICKGELEAIERIAELNKKFLMRTEPEPPKGIRL